MARMPRFVAAKQPHLVAQSASSDSGLFRDTEDFVNFSALLKNSAKVNGIAIHAFAFTPREVLLLATPAEGPSLSHFMQDLGRRYVPYFNLKYKRAGSLWQARFRTAAVDATHHFVAASRYVEEAPVRAGLVANPADYCWSSFGAHIGRESLPWLTDHAVYWSLGNTPFDREATYQRLAEQALPPAEIALIESGLRGGWPIGSAAFAATLQKEAGRRLQRGRRGRPVKSKADLPSEGQ